MTQILKALNSANETVNFAVKSGSHNPNCFGASQDVVISMSSFNEVVYDANSQTVLVGSGLRWQDVIAALDPYNVTVVGGRVGHVGMGLVLGGGLSFKSAQYGWAANTIANYEIVLANGSIVNANATSMFHLLKVSIARLTSSHLITQATQTYMLH